MILLFKLVLFVIFLVGFVNMGLGKQLAVAFAFKDEIGLGETSNCDLFWWCWLCWLWLCVGVVGLLLDAADIADRLFEFVLELLLFVVVVGVVVIVLIIGSIGSCFINETFNLFFVREKII